MSSTIVGASVQSDREGVARPFIEGSFLDSMSARRIAVINPSNGEHCRRVSEGCNEDVESAVASARRAFEDGRWREMAPSSRICVMRRFADLIVTHAGALDALDACEMGKPVSETFCNAAAAGGLTQFYAEAIDKVLGDVYSSDKTSFVAQRRVPRGVVAAIVPWNFPTFNAVLKIAPALAAGNCVVLKPAEQSPSSALSLAQLAVEAGLPPGVFNVVPGIGATIGRALGIHPNIDMVAFTGSTRVGKLMLQYAGQSNMKIVQAECGGKSPQIVFDDGVDLDSASEAIAGFLLVNQGQICSVGSRLLVQRSIETALIDMIAAHFERIKMGDARDPNTTFGPLVSARQRARVMEYIEAATEEGAQLVVGGHAALPQSNGFFIEPTLFRNVKPTARIAQEEVFGPVLSVIAFEDEAEALRIANGTMYGLSAYVWTAKLSTGLRMMKGIRSEVIINAAAPHGEGPGHAMSSEPNGQSGLGVEGGLAGLESYMRRQLVWFNHAG